MTTPPKPRPAYRFLAGTVRPVVKAVTKRDWAGHEQFPREGGFVVCPNHLSHVDVFALAHFVYDSGREPYFLGKRSVFKIPIAGKIFAKAGMIPVDRETGKATHAYRAAVDAVRGGKCVAIYPEGTLTRDPDLWPMTGKTGAARIALETRCPVIPVAQWGPQEIMGRYQKNFRLFPRKVMRVRAGGPVDLSDLYDQPISGAVLREATERIMAAITRELEILRGEQAPALRFDSRSKGVPVTGRYRPEDHPELSLPGTEPASSGGQESRPESTVASHGENDEPHHHPKESR